MNITAFRNTVEQISTDSDIASRAKRRVLSEEKKARKIRFLPAAAAAVMMCGITVSAVTIDWTKLLFGSSADIIANDPNAYKIELGNIRTESDTGYSFTVGDAVSDGESLYINLLVDGFPEDFSETLSISVINTDDFDPPRFAAEWRILDGNGNTALFVNPESGISAGDHFEISLEDYPFSETLGRLSFDIESEPCRMAKVINVEKNAVFTNHYTENHDPVRPEYIDFYVKSVKISPLGYTVYGSYYGEMDGNDDIGVMMSPENFFLIYKNGEIKEVPADGAGGSAEYGVSYSTDWIIEKNFCEVINLDEVCAVQIGNLVIPID